MRHATWNAINANPGVAGIVLLVMFVGVMAWPGGLRVSCCLRDVRRKPYQRHFVGAASPAMQLLQTILPSAPAHEPSHLDIRGFLAGLALSSAIGAVLYIFLMTV